MKPVDPIDDLEATENLGKTYDAADPKQVNDARTKAGRGKKKERQVIAALMQHEDGRKVLFDSVRCLLEGNPLVPGDPYSTYFNLGQEHRARELFKEILKVAPENFIVMMKEYS